MYDLRGCRACLNQDCKLERINETTRRLYCTVTGLDFTLGDCYPSYLCVECSSQIKKTLAFRRRCRRAFFVLKEIVAVRKKVTLADLATVDRKKTNLMSNIDYWRNNNNGFYSINRDTEYDTKPSDIREFLTEFEPQNYEVDTKPNIHISVTKYAPNVINNTYVAVDIKPDNCDDTYNEVVNKIECPNDDEIDNNDIYDDNLCGNETADDNLAADEIDLNDVFKGLSEDKSDDESDYGLAELLEEEEEQKKLVKAKPVKIGYSTMNTKHCGMPLYKAFPLSQAITNFTIQLLSLEEQLETFQTRRTSEPYKSAGFKCSMCLTIFPGMPELMKHVQMHNKKQTRLTPGQRKMYQCMICKDAFSCQEELTAHSACNHWYKYHCKKCRKDKFTLNDILKCHNMKPISVSHSYTMEEMFKMSDMTSQLQLEPMERNCRLCGWRFVKKENKHKHERGHIITKVAPHRHYRYQCDMCGVSCRLKMHLESHMNIHYKTFTCKLCNQVFDGWNAAHEHLKEHKKFKCQNCEETFNSEKQRRNHQIFHVGSDAKYDCNLCGAPVYTLRKLYCHQLTNHGYVSIKHSSLGDPKYRCEMCGIQFVDESSLKNHMLKKGHVEANKLGGKCESCKRIFFNVVDFVAHRRDSTSCKRYPVKCVYCDEMLANFRMSERHYEQAHPAQPNEHHNAMLYTICEYCGKIIVKNHIKAHTKRHTRPGAEPTLTCTVCRAKITTSKAYVSHMLFNHTPKPYLCALCPFRAKYRSECREHILKVHAPELLYNCKKCKRRFSHLDLLQQHSVRAHGVSVKDDRNAYLPAKDVMGKIYVFPHMKIDGSFIDPAIIEAAGLYKYDYLCKSCEPVNFTDYYVFDTGVEPTLLDPSVHKKRNTKRSFADELNIKVKGSAIRSISDNIEVTPNVETGKRRGRKRKFKVESGIESGEAKSTKLNENDKNRNNSEESVKNESKVEEYDMPYLEQEIFEDKTEIIEEIVHDYDVVYQNEEEEEISENVEEETSENVGDVYEEIDISKLMSEHYEVIEENGEQYVVMNGELYKLQIDDD